MAGIITDADVPEIVSDLLIISPTEPTKSEIVTYAPDEHCVRLANIRTHINILVRFVEIVPWIP